MSPTVTTDHGPPAAVGGVRPWANLHHTGPDGARLALDIHLPPEPRWPVTTVVTRTPYGRFRHLAEGRGWTDLGVAYVVSDVRGRYDSEGVWDPYRHEHDDGAALIDWITAQDWSDGKVVVYGGSYAAYTAWAMAAARPGTLAGVVSMGPSMGLHSTKFDACGTLRLAEHTAWWMERGETRTSREGLTRHVFAEQPHLLEQLPVTSFGTSLGVDLPRLNDVLPDATGRPGRDEHVVDPAAVRALRCPSLHVGGWYDLLLPDTLRLYELIGADRAPRPPRSLLIGPWEHDLAFTTSTAVGARDHGPASTVRFGDTLRSWLHHAGVARVGPPAPAWDGACAPGRARVFVLGSNTWHDTEQWPVPRTGTLTLFTDADDRLHPDEPTASATTAFDYDPLDPCPSRAAGMDRAELGERADVVRWWTEPLTRAVTAQGSPTVELCVRTSAPTADWTARLLHHVNGGAVVELTAGTVVARTGTDRCTVTLDPVAVHLPRGARLGLELTTSDFPRLARNLNGSDDPRDRYVSTTTTTALQQVHTGRGGTTVRLPVTSPTRGGPT